MKAVTIESLIDLKACKDQIELFKVTFGDSCDLTRENLQKAIDVKLDLEWWIRKIYGDAAIKPYWAAYLDAIDLHWDAYQAAKKTYLDAYYAAIQQHQDAYLVATKPHWDAYELAIKPHQDVYKAAIKPHEDAYELAIKPHQDVYKAAIKPHEDAYREAIKLCWEAYLNSLIEFVLDKNKI